MNEKVVDLVASVPMRKLDDPGRPPFIALNIPGGWVVGAAIHDREQVFKC